MLFNYLLAFYLSIYAPNADLWTFNGDQPTRDKIFQQYKNNSQEKWALENIETGDIIFRKGDEYIFGMNFSDYICSITKSKYSHCAFGIKFINRVWIIDCDRSGVRKIPFSLFMNETKYKYIKVMRVKEEYNENILPAINYCWVKYFKNAPFDFNFVNGGDEFYCAELVARSYAAGKLCLMAPIKVANLPGISDRPFQNVLVMFGSRFYCRKQFDFEKKLYTAEGISRSNKLTTIFEGEL